MREVAFRFAVRADNECRSGIWKVWSPPNASDVYISCREMKGDFKVSLHKSGHFLAGFTQPYEKKLREYGAWSGSRHMERWKVERPVNQPVLTIRILIPGTELRRLTGAEQARKPVRWIPAPPEDCTASVEIVLANARLEFTEAGHPEILTCWELPSGEEVWIGHRVASTPDSINEAIADYRSRERTKLDGRRDWDTSHPEGRILIFGPNVGGWRSFLDVAAAPLRTGSIKTISVS